MFHLIISLTTFAFEKKFSLSATGIPWKRRLCSKSRGYSSMTFVMSLIFFSNSLILYLNSFDS